MIQIAPIALTCGEPAGIGPELMGDVWSTCAHDLPLFWIGDPRHLPADCPFVEIADPNEAANAMPTGLPVLTHNFGDKPRTPGRPISEHAPHIVSAIERAVSLVQSGAASAICTAPIHKKALKDGAQFAFPGHTEFLAHLAGREDVVMMLASDSLRVVPATIHIALSEVVSQLTPESLETTLLITHEGLRDLFGIAAPRIAVAGLNPHAGEGGTMGREEITLIAPVIERLRAKGLEITGPLSADTMFHEKARAGYDAAVCMYHDQALIPIKTLAFDNGVNVTLGLPFIRTSPDHGTAFDIAGKGLANPTSMISAVRMAARMARAQIGAN